MASPASDVGASSPASRAGSGPSRAKPPILCLVTDASVARGPLTDAVAAAVRGGVDTVQLRDRAAPALALLAQLDELRATCGTATWVVNRRLDVAWAGAADGVHLGFDGLPAREARKLLGTDAWLSMATHDPDELAGHPARELLSHAHLAPIFAPLSKPGTRPPLGLAALERAARHGVPILAQGGITAARTKACLEAGAAGIAVTGEILASDDPEAAARALRRALED